MNKLQQTVRMDMLSPSVPTKPIIYVPTMTLLATGSNTTKT